MDVSAGLVISTPISTRPASSLRVSAWTEVKRGKLCVSAYAAATAMNPVWRMPPPNNFLNQRAFWMYALVPTKHDPIGAPDK